MSDGVSPKQSFEDLPVWIEARELARVIYRETRKPAFSRDRALTDQIRRAAISVSSNIAEGFERQYPKDFLLFLSYAKGSAGEVRSQLHLAYDQGYLDDEALHHALERCLSVSRQLGGMLRSFRNRT